MDNKPILYEITEDLEIEMTDDNNEKVKVKITKRFDYDNKHYVIADDMSNDTDSYILEVKSSPEGDMLVSIDDYDEFNKICKALDAVEE